MKGRKISLFKVFMPPRNELMPALEKVLYSGYIGEGPVVKEFENTIGNFIGVEGQKHVLGLNTGTAALQLAVRLSGASDGGEVITTPMTCTATNEPPIVGERAKIVWADIDPTSGSISPKSIREKITQKSKAIVVVHWGGNPVDLDAINKIAREHNLKVIEDAAHALGTEYRGRKIGNRTSDFTCFSFQAIKQITTIDGGALVCKHQSDRERGRLLRWYGIDREKGSSFRCKVNIQEWGYKFHMNDVNATVGLVQMPYLKQILAYRRKLAAYYDHELKNIAGVKIIKVLPGCNSAYWLYTILVENRTDFIRWMAENNIVVSQVHARNDKHTMFKKFKCNNLPGVDYFSKRQCSIPIGFWVTQEDAEYIVETIKRGW